MFVTRSETFKFVAGETIHLPCEVSNAGKCESWLTSLNAMFVRPLTRHFIRDDNSWKTITDNNYCGIANEISYIPSIEFWEEFLGNDFGSNAASSSSSKQQNDAELPIFEFRVFCEFPYWIWIFVQFNCVNTTPPLSNTTLTIANLKNDCGQSGQNPLICNKNDSVKERTYAIRISFGFWYPNVSSEMQNLFSSVLYRSTYWLSSHSHSL